MNLVSVSDLISNRPGLSARVIRLFGAGRKESRRKSYRRMRRLRREALACGLLEVRGE